MSKRLKESVEGAQLVAQKALGVAILHQNVLNIHELKVDKLEQNWLPDGRRRSVDMSDVVYQLVDGVRSAVQMAYAALGVGRLNSAKIVELEGRLRSIEGQIDSLMLEYEEEKCRARGKAIAAGKWRAKAGRLQADLDQLSLQMSGS